MIVLVRFEKMNKKKKLKAYMVCNVVDGVMGVIKTINKAKAINIVMSDLVKNGYIDEDWIKMKKDFYGVRLKEVDEFDFSYFDIDTLPIDEDDEFFCLDKFIQYLEEEEEEKKK